MNVPDGLSYTKDHEWVRFEEGGIATVGITEYAQNSLGDIVYVELPKIGAQCAAGTQAATVESVKAVSEVFCPVSGKVVAVNTKLESEPELLNKDPYGEWMFQVEGSAHEPMLTADEYRALL